MASSTLQAICTGGDYDQLKKILDSSSNPSQAELDSALSFAIDGDHPEIVSLLLSFGARITASAFFGAVRNGNPAIFQEFLNYGWDINSVEFGEPGLRLVVDSETCVKWFLEHGADPNLTGNRGATPLATAALRPSTGVLELLIAHGAELDAQALYSAIAPRGKGGVPIMSFLIDRGVDVNASSRQWGTPLHYAVRTRDKERVQLLLDKGADLTAIVNGQTPADLAKSIGQLELHKMLSK